MNPIQRCPCLLLLIAWTVCADCVAEESRLSVSTSGRELAVIAGSQPLLRYVFHDDQIARPYFKDLKTPQGLQVSRHHPPRPGVDADDHALLHPGLWLAFGDLNGSDSWRLKASVVHDRFLAEPRASADRVTFTVANRYLSAGGELVCREDCRYELVRRGGGWLLLWDSRFTPDRRELVFGDQEEMGLGVRMATPLSVKNGGEISNSSGQKNEKGCWGQPADWCDYGGSIEAARCGIVVMGHPSNFKRCSFHARDYGFMAANPFAEKAFGRSQTAARTVIQPGDSLRLRFGVLVYHQPAGTMLDAAAEYANFLKLSAEERR